MKNPVHSGNGFTLLEVLVAGSLFSLLLLALPTMLVTTTRTDSRGRQISAAMTLAQDKLEQLYKTDYAAVASGADAQPLTETLTTGGALAMYARRWTVSAGPIAGTKAITIRVDWSAPDATHVTLQGMVHQ